jgi:hypothetical protein
MYIDEQGIQFSDDKKTLLHFPSNLVGVYIIPEGLEEIAEDAFAYTDLTAIAVPEGVKHWHGAQRDSWFQHYTTHVATSAELSNEWLEPVTDDVYDKLR